MLNIIRAGMYTSVQDGDDTAIVSPVLAIAARWTNRRCISRTCWWGMTPVLRRWRLRSANWWWNLNPTAGLH